MTDQTASRVGGGVLLAIASEYRATFVSNTNVGELASMPKKKGIESPGSFATCSLSFEESIARLEELLAQLEDGQCSLAESLAAYEEGIKHLKVCHESLAIAERKIEILSGFDAAGNPITRPFDDAATLGEAQVGRRSRPLNTAADSQNAATSEVDDPPGLF